MPEAETRPNAKEKEGRIDTVKPPASLPDASALERMTELTRRIFRVPKAEAVPPKKRVKRNR